MFLISCCSKNTEFKEMNVAMVIYYIIMPVKYVHSEFSEFIFYK